MILPTVDTTETQDEYWEPILGGNKTMEYNIVSYIITKIISEARPLETFDCIGSPPHPNCNQTLKYEQTL